MTSVGIKTMSVVVLVFLLVGDGEAICEKVCSQKNHYRTEPAYHAQVSLRTPAALGKTKGISEKPKFFKRSSLITEFDLPSANAGEDRQQTVIVREGLV